MLNHTRNSLALPIRVPPHQPGAAKRLVFLQAHSISRGLPRQGQLRGLSFQDPLYAHFLRSVSDGLCPETASTTHALGTCNLELATFSSRRHWLCLLSAFPPSGIARRSGFNRHNQPMFSTFHKGCHSTFFAYYGRIPSATQPLRQHLMVGCSKPAAAACARPSLGSGLFSENMLT